MLRPANKSLLQRIWAWGCSLKLAIYVASTATVLIMSGSLVMHRHPEVFGPMDQMLMAQWLPGAWRRAPQLVWWIPVSGLCLLVFGLNTLCCLSDWLLHIRKRWRKSGEYLIHTGFSLLVIAYAWNCVDGFRSGPHRFFPGERLELAQMPGYALQLEQFTPKLSDRGQPLDMVNLVSLWQGSREIMRSEVRINHPLTYQGLIVLPTSFGRQLEGFRFHLPGQGLLDLATGSILPLPGGGELRVLRLLPDARQNNRGQVMPGSDQLGNPAMQLAIRFADGGSWQGWYFLRGPLPREMAAAGLYLRPIEPLFRIYSLLSVNRDPGSGLALAGGTCMGIGVLFALFSFYAKRARGDRPEY